MNILSANKTIHIQVEVLSIIIIVGVIFIFLFALNNTIKKSDPLVKPKGLLLIGIIYYQMMLNLAKSNMNSKAAAKYAPYIAALALFMVISNISGLVGLSAPTSNYSVTLSLALISWILIQRTKIKENSLMGYIKGFFEPIPPFVIMNIFGTLAPLISMSLRLFGNITSGTIIMTLFYTFTGFVSSFVPLIGGFNFIGAVLAPFLHSYFDLMSGLIQTYIFIMLTMIFIGNELPQD